MNYRDKLISYNGKSSPDTILDYYQELDIFAFDDIAKVCRYLNIVPDVTSIATYEAAFNKKFKAATEYSSRDFIRDYNYYYFLPKKSEDCNTLILKKKCDIKVAADLIDRG